ncbi:hypothetical protein WA026_006728 [Henosepilachna vigintioctopunctata]|uniref:Ionotropic receptor n=1 Tax=Henosepilachna vigintioctopunctata TaxID=420089 RepID=A0AAW1UGI3_9CUCU
MIFFNTSYKLFSVIQCVNVILREQTENLDLILTINTEYQVDLPTMRRNLYEKYVMKSIYLKKPDFYLIEDLTVIEIGKFCAHEEEFDYTFNPRAKFLFLARNFSTDVLNFMSRYFIYNAIFLDTTTGKILTYFAFQEIENQEFTEVGHCGVDGSITLTSELYPDKIPKQWQNSSIRIMYQPMEIFTICHDKCEKKGIDVEIFDLIAKWHGIVIQYVHLVSEVDFKDYYKNQINAHIGCLDMRISVEYTYPHIYENLVWFVPQPPPVPRWKYFLYIFSLPVWIMWVLATTVLSATWCFGDYILGKRISFRTILSVPYIIFILFVENFCDTDTNTSFREILILFMIFLSTMMNFFFKCRLTYFLNGLNYERGIESVEDVIASDLKVGCTRRVAHIVSVDPKLKTFLKNNFIECFSYYCLNRTSYVGDQATVTLMALIQNNNVSYVDKTTNRYLLKVLPNPIYMMPLVSHFNKGHPMYFLFNQNIQRLLETGIIEKISRGYFLDKRLKEISLNATQSLNFSHIMGPLSVWMLGVAASVTTLFFELFFFYIRSQAKCASRKLNKRNGNLEK